MGRGMEEGLSRMEGLTSLEHNQLLRAARADLLRRLGRKEEAGAAYRRALSLAVSPIDQEFLRERLTQLGK